MRSKSPIILALDFNDIASTLKMIEQTDNYIGVYKLGLEFYLTHGKVGVLEVTSNFKEIEIFLDLKLHDIPNTVAGACRAVLDLAPRFITVHASGGAEMIKAAVSSASGVEITAVTILTSIDRQEMGAMGYPGEIESLTLSLAQNAVHSGAKAIVSSPHEVSLLRERLGRDITLITPGVRPAGSARDDQERVMTPAQAIAAGADFVVIGRPITKAADPRAAAEAIIASLV